MIRKSVLFFIVISVVFGLGVVATNLFINHKKDILKHNKSQNLKHKRVKHIHDEVNMPGLNRKNISDVEINDLKVIFENHRNISRKVINLTNGIKNLTEISVDSLREKIVTHLSMMIARLQEGRNPEVIIQSPTLDKLFVVYEEINTEI